jgi:hypothetical protein
MCQIKYLAFAKKLRSWNDGLIVVSYNIDLQRCLDVRSEKGVYLCIYTMGSCMLCDFPFVITNLVFFQQGVDAVFIIAIVIISGHSFSQIHPRYDIIVVRNKLKKKLRDEFKVTPIRPIIL